MHPGAAATASFAIIAFFLLIPPFAWHLKSKNIPAIFLVFWLIIINLIGFINAMIWSGDNFTQVYDGQGWCDITTKLEAGSGVGKLCAITCISMNLYMILCAKHPSFMDPKSWKKITIDLVMCLFTPIFIMSTNFIIQSKRYYIARYNGCVTVYSPTNATIGLFLVWPVIWSIIALIFALLTLYKYFQKRKDVKDLLKCTNSGLNLKRFARLLIFNFLIVFAMTPLAILYFTQQNQYIESKFNWNVVHDSTWGQIQYVDIGFFTMADRIVNITLSIIAFLLFGLGKDALSMYKSFFRRFQPKRFNNSKDDNFNSGTLSKQTTYINSSTPTKLLSNKSQFSAGTNFSQPTMRDFNEFGDVINELGLDDNLNNNSSSLNLESKTELLKDEDDEAKIGYIEVEDSNLNDDILYTYEVKQKI
ncbi:STE3 [Candida pseudojiufengensis]|uniref:STE3 n=1 Tax=Candida pseudojiufengensis TaxID=497109 RepID=UPI0022254EE9|nr:STE3 [Candida pseudojiufengensis]KAI5960400.1 STE3 [Candida pseudojiufengensis]